MFVSSSISIFSQPNPIPGSKLFLPAQLGVDVFEAVAEDAAHVPHVEEHEGDAEDGVQYRRQLPEIGLRCQIAVP